VEMTTLFYLIESGYTVTSKTGFDRTSYAENKKEDDRFYFDVRKKQAPSYRRVTDTWEYGIDLPDYFGYFESEGMGIPFLVFFETEKPAGIRWIDRDIIKQRGRVWKDETHFPNGIIFVNVTDTTKWEHGIPFTNYRRVMKVQKELSGKGVGV
jgi:hypothetical protein